MYDLTAIGAPRAGANLSIRKVTLGALVALGTVCLSLNPVYGTAIMAVGCVIAIAASTPSARTVTATTVLLCVMPDSPTLFHISRLAITPRILMLVLVGFQWTFAVARGSIRARLSFRPVWTLYTVVVVIGAALNHRTQDIPLFLLLVLLPYAVGCSFGANNELLRGVLRGVMVGSCLLGAIAILEFIRHKAFLAPVYDLSEYKRAGNLRANAGWQHPLALGMFLCLGVFITVDAARRQGAVWAMAVALLIAGGIFATQERSPIIGLAAGGLVFMLLQSSAKARTKAAMSAVLIVLAVLAMPGSSGSSFREFLSQSTQKGTAASADVTGRSELLGLGIKAIAKRPLFGFGYGSGASISANPSLLPLLTRGHTFYTDIANWPLSIAIETGWLGLACIVAIFGGALTRLIRSRHVSGPLPVVPAAAGLVGAAVTSFGVAALPSSVLFMFVIGLFSSGCLASGSIIPRQMSQPAPEPQVKHTRTRASERV